MPGSALYLQLWYIEKVGSISRSWLFNWISFLPVYVTRSGASVHPEMGAVSRVSGRHSRGWTYSCFKNNNIRFSLWKTARCKESCHWFWYVQRGLRSGCDSCYALVTQGSMKKLLAGVCTQNWESSARKPAYVVKVGASSSARESKPTTMRDSHLVSWVCADLPHFWSDPLLPTGLQRANSICKFNNVAETGNYYTYFWKIYNIISSCSELQDDNKRRFMCFLLT